MKIYPRAAAAAALFAALGMFAIRGTPPHARAHDLLALPAGPELPPEAKALDVKVAVEVPAQIDSTPIGSIDPAPPQPTPLAAISSIPRLSPFELARFSATASLYRKGLMAAADAIATTVSDPVQRTALAWVALKSAPSHERLDAFEAAHKDWPATAWLRDLREGWLYTEKAPANVIAGVFSREPPHTTAGMLAAARASLQNGRKDDAAAQVRAMWRERDLDAWTENAVLREFGGLLTRADHKYRADRLLYAEKPAPALRAAALAGADVVALANARWQAANGPLTPAAIAAIPGSLQSDPGLVFARVQDARRGGRTAEADAWIALAPKDPAALVDPDKWWSERRMVAREWLDRGGAAQAYKLCAEAQTVNAPAKIDAAFHAGWIALRFLDDPAKAERHFADASAAAITPLALARAHYWQGRAAEALGKSEESRRFYEGAASYPIAYYGQLAAKRLGRDGALAPRAPALMALGDDRAEATRVVDLYFDAGLDDFAGSLALAAASTWTDEAQVAALGAVIAKRANATLNVTFGKIATERGFAVDETAFPTFGLPSFSPLPHSADAVSVLAVARQESEFIWRAASGAGAKGLMQILPSTAEMTARRAGVAYDFARLIGDPAFNLQLGAAYLGQLMEDEGGSLEMTLAAYNAGAGRVQQWIAAYGDPRAGAVDPVDWVERIPFDETRDYVQRVSENVGIYRARLAGRPPVVAQPARLARE